MSDAERTGEESALGLACELTAGEYDEEQNVWLVSVPRLVRGRQQCLAQYAFGMRQARLAVTDTVTKGS
jgi:hypothetical protein